MIETKKPTLWLCTKCWTIMPRADAEKLSAAQGAPSGTTDWKCPLCGVIGQFASDSSGEFAEFAIDLPFENLAACIQEAGYEVPQYSAQCDKKDHRHCPGTNRLPGYCQCKCHRSEPASIRLRVEELRVWLPVLTISLKIALESDRISAKNKDTIGRLMARIDRFAQRHGAYWDTGVMNPENEPAPGSNTG